VSVDEGEVSSAVTYSFVVPVHNEEGPLPILTDRLVQVMRRLDGDSEVIFVDDGSTDRSWDFLATLHAHDRRFKAIQLSRNFGHQVAITAGMDLAEGQAVVVMDADLQDPPEVVLEMAARWREGYEVVYGVRQDRSTDRFFKRFAAAAFYKVLDHLTDVDIPQNVGDFRLIDRRAVDTFRAMREGSRFVRGMYAWIGFRQVGVPYRREVRAAGQTKYPLKKMLRLAADGVLSFSLVPLQMVMKFGVAAAAASLLAAIVAACLKIFGGYGVPGWTSILLAVCLLGSIQLVVLGVIGQYLGRVFEASLARPLYVVSQLRGIAAPSHPLPRAIIAVPPSAKPVLAEPMGDAEAMDLRLVSDPRRAGSL
jgi:dolichol-phosphate mannosyltransferase